MARKIVKALLLALLLARGNVHAEGDAIGDAVEAAGDAASDAFEHGEDKVLGVAETMNDAVAAVTAETEALVNQAEAAMAAAASSVSKKIEQVAAAAESVADKVSGTDIVVKPRNDWECRYSWKTKACEPARHCEYRYQVRALINLLRFRLQGQSV
jgi:hypothetical protein